MVILLDIVQRVAEFIRDIGDIVVQTIRREIVTRRLKALQDGKSAVETTSPGIDTSALVQGIVEIRTILKKEDIPDEDVKTAKGFCRELLGE